MFSGIKSSCVMRLIAYKRSIIQCVLLICEQVRQVIHVLILEV